MTKPDITMDSGRLSDGLVHIVGQLTFPHAGHYSFNTVNDVIRCTISKTTIRAVEPVIFLRTNTAVVATCMACIAQEEISP